MALAAIEDAGEPVEPADWCKWAWRAWHALTNDRYWRGGGLGPAMPCGIPYAAVALYASQHELEIDFLHSLIQEMDTVFIAWFVQKVKMETSKDG